MTPWLHTWSAFAAPASSIIGGVLALTAAGLVVVITTALGPDVRVLRCMDGRGRSLAYLAAFWWFVRGVMILTTGDRTHQHWDTVLSWGATVLLASYVLAGVWAERMPPEVRVRFDRREDHKKRRVQHLVAKGEVGCAALVAAGGDLGDAQTYAVGLAPETANRLHDLP